MTEAIFAAWLVTVGVLLLAPTSRRIPWWGAAFLAPIAATALYILIALLLIAVSFFSVIVAVILATAAAVGVSIFALSRKVVTLGWLGQAVGGAIVIAITVTVVASQVPLVRLTTDSYHYLMSAVALVRSGTLEGVSDSFLLKRQLAVPLLHTLGVETGLGYVSFWTPLLGVSVFGTMTWLALDGLRHQLVPRKWQWMIVLPTLAFALTTNRVIYHFFYINGHMLFAGLLLGAVGLGWLAVRTNGWTLLLPASVMFAALIPLRAESAIVVGGFLVVFVSSGEIPIRWRWTLLGPTVAAVVLWDGWVMPRLLSSVSVDLMKSPLAELVVVAGLVVLLALSSTGRFDRFVRLAPWIALGGLAVILGALVIQNPTILGDTVVAMSTATIATGYWGTLWMILPLMFLGAIAIGFSRDRFMIIGLLAFILIIPLLAYLRGGAFHFRTTDSANRMLMHVVPLVILVIILAAGTVAASLSTDDEDQGVATPRVDA
jgi:hypothetical protein